MLTPLLTTVLLLTATPSHVSLLQPPEMPRASLRLTSDEPLEANEPTSAMSPGGRRAILLLLGGVGTAGGLLFGAYVGSLVDSCNFPCDIISSAPTFLGGTAGMLLGTSLVTHGVGRFLGGTGRYFWTFVGSAVGTLAGLIAFPVLAINGAPVALALPVALMMPATGALLGYEGSTPEEQPRVMPLLTASARGMHAGVRMWF